MPRLLLLFAHPAYDHSRAHKQLLQHLPNDPRLTFRDLYERYPDFYIEVEEEKRLLSEHDIVVWQHPVYWYSCPPLLKQWIDLVLEFGWAYGPGGVALHGKRLLHAVSTGGGRHAYQPDGLHRHTLRQFLAPFERTAQLCGMEYLPPFVAFGTHRLTDQALFDLSLDYARLVRHLMDDEDGSFARQLAQCEYANDCLPALQSALPSAS
ncbi:MAG: NAD(P)H-dependent oxidoreductase [Saprospiraceae bacterium]|nr:NAD(P)H-dependent oxidoreductase [Saprospiraceae bacterium]MDW8230799.1 NAD(P)H-dependent oxidoreductase [Saprospiraceae bacterium]